MITADDWMGMYHMADDRADKAEAEVERLKLMVKSITGGLDEAIETVQFLEAENARLRKVAEAARGMWWGAERSRWDVLEQALAELDKEDER